MGCTAGIIKYLVFLFNLVFAIAGLVMLGIGIAKQLELKDTLNAIDNKILSLAPTLLITIGAIVFLISFFGCCGAIKENTCMLTTYGVVLLGLLILQIAIGAYAFIQVKDNDGSFQKELDKALKKSYDAYSKEKPIQEAIDVMQQALQCCGNKSPNDFENIPPSCCKSNAAGCSSLSSDFFRSTCNKKFYDTVKSNIEVIGYVALGLCITEIVAAVFALYLTSSIRSDRRHGRYA